MGKTYWYASILYLDIIFKMSVSLLSDDYKSKIVIINRVSQIIKHVI